jgi:hypothetical protein
VSSSTALLLQAAHQQPAAEILAADIWKATSSSDSFMTRIDGG